MKYLLSLLFIVMSVFPSEAQTDFRIFDLAWSPDGHFLVFSTSYGIHLFDAATQTRLWKQPSDQYLNTVIFSPDGQLIAAGGNGLSGSGGLIYVWETETGRQIAQFRGNAFAVYELAFSPDGTRLAGGGGYIPTRGGGDYKVHLWDTATWQENSDIQLFGTGFIGEISFSPDGRFLAFSSPYRGIYLINAKTYDILANIHEGAARDIRFEGDKVLLNFSNQVQVWELHESPEVYLIRQTVWRSEGESIVDLNGGRMITSAEDHVLRIRDIRTNQLLNSYQEEGRLFGPARWSPDGSRIAFITDDASLPSYSSEYKPDHQAAIWTPGEAPIKINVP